MADSDFERVCAARFNVAEKLCTWERICREFPDWAAEERRGMAAALREMLRQSSGRGAGQLRERAAVRACLEALLAQAEDQEAAE